ncbi:MAG: hypothetical protein IJG87_04525 [Ruminococcus sp.]|nr:hypothetical protein [Ruminococcus sp.]
MSFQILWGEDFAPGFLEKIMEIDRIVYKSEYVGELSKMQARYHRNPRTFVCVMDGERVAGYINFFPVVQALWDEITETGMKIRDDDIRPDELADYEKGKDAVNNLFIISVAVHPDYQNDKKTVIALTDGWIAYLNKLREEGIPITAIAATAVSPDGMRFLSTRLFCVTREIEEGNKVYVCDGDRLEKLLDGELYFKSYRDDVYLLIPFAENSRNPKTAKKLFRDGTAQSGGLSGPGWIEDDEEDEPDDESVPFDESDVRYLIGELDNCQRYECTSEAKDELQRFYCGEFLLMLTHDDYPDEEDPSLNGRVKSGVEGMPDIFGEVKAYLSILSHRPSHMYVAMLIIPNCPYSTSQLEDQLFHDYLKLRCSENTPEEIRAGWGEQIDVKGHYLYRALGEFLETEYGLLPCGSGKVLTCMSARPKQEQEFLNILSGETYFSLHQDFFINSRELRKIASENRAIYDYYEAYMSEKVVAFLFCDFQSLTGLQNPDYWGGKVHFRRRSELTATYIFIIELVMFQNTALNKMTMKVSNALAQDGDVSYDYMNDLYRDYARSVKFWNNDNFRYLGTQQEASQIREVFDNDELRQTYQELQNFLEQMIELQSAQDERRSGMVINFLAVFLAVVQIKDFIVSMLDNFYSGFHIDVGTGEADHTFTSLLVGGVFLFMLFRYILTRKRRQDRRDRIREHYRKIFDADKTGKPSGPAIKEGRRRG